MGHVQSASLPRPSGSGPPTAASASFIQTQLEVFPVFFFPFSWFNSRRSNFSSFFAVVFNSSIITNIFHQCWAWWHLLVLPLLFFLPDSHAPARCIAGPVEASPRLQQADVSNVTNQAPQQRNWKTEADGSYSWKQRRCFLAVIPLDVCLTARPSVTAALVIFPRSQLVLQLFLFWERLSVELCVTLLFCLNVAGRESGRCTGPRNEDRNPKIWPPRYRRLTLVWSLCLTRTVWRSV